MTEEGPGVRIAGGQEVSFAPGRKVPASGVYRLTPAREATLIRGQRFPPARGGQEWHAVYLSNGGPPEGDCPVCGAPPDWDLRFEGDPR